jgi:hypothetical protein
MSNAFAEYTRNDDYPHIVRMSCTANTYGLASGRGFIAEAQDYLIARFVLRKKFPVIFPKSTIDLPETTPSVLHFSQVDGEHN